MLMVKYLILLLLLPSFYAASNTSSACNKLKSQWPAPLALSDVKMSGLLTGIMGSSSPARNLRTVTKFLKGRNEPVYKILESAFQIEGYRGKYQEDYTKLLARHIYQKLQSHGTSHLMQYGSKNHSMGLRIQHADEGNLFFDIFNSGQGLKYHSKIKINGKMLYQTMLRVQVPKNQLTEKFLYDILNHSEKTIEVSYDTILSIANAQIIEPEPDEIVWQSDQISGNCALEWIFAVLRNIMGLERYTKMRMALYQEALDSLCVLEPESEKKIQVECSAKPRDPLVEVSVKEADGMVREHLNRKLHKSLNPDEFSPNDLTGAFLAKKSALENAQSLLQRTPESTANIMDALRILERLADKGEAVEEATKAAKRFIGYPEEVIRTRAIQILNKLGLSSEITIPTYMPGIPGVTAAIGFISIHGNILSEEDFHNLFELDLNTEEASIFAENAIVKNPYKYLEILNNLIDKKHWYYDAAARAALLSFKERPSVALRLLNKLSSKDPKYLEAASKSAETIVREDPCIGMWLLDDPLDKGGWYEAGAQGALASFGYYPWCALDVAVRLAYKDPRYQKVMDEIVSKALNKNPVRTLEILKDLRAKEILKKHEETIVQVESPIKSDSYAL